MKHALTFVMVLSLAAACSKSDKDKSNKSPAKKPDSSKPADSKKPATPPAVLKAATTEARVFVKKIYDGARVYYMDAPPSKGLTPTPRAFPQPAVGPTPPLGTCCKNPDKKCKPDAKQWASPVWTVLQFSVDDPHYYSYSYKGTATEFTARAYGDLDCNGVYSTFELTGRIDAKNPDGPSGAATLRVDKELE